MSPADVKKQQHEMDALNETLTGMRILKGVECDILDDGSLDYHDSVLKTFDYVVASVHTSFHMSADDMTRRICKAPGTSGNNHVRPRNRQTVIETRRI